MKLFKNGARAFCILNFPSLFGATIPLPGLSALSLFIPCTITRQVSAACSVDDGTGGDWVAKQCGVPVRRWSAVGKRNKTRLRRARGQDFVSYIIRSNFESIEIWNKWAMHSLKGDFVSNNVTISHCHLPLSPATAIAIIICFRIVTDLKLSRLTYAFYLPGPISFLPVIPI